MGASFIGAIHEVHSLRFFSHIKPIKHKQDYDSDFHRTQILDNKQKISQQCQDRNAFRYRREGCCGYHVIMSPYNEAFYRPHRRENSRHVYRSILYLLLPQHHSCVSIWNLFFHQSGEPLPSGAIPNAQRWFFPERLLRSE